MCSCLVTTEKQTFRLALWIVRPSSSIVFLFSRRVLPRRFVGKLYGHLSTSRSGPTTRGIPELVKKEWIASLSLTSAHGIRLMDAGNLRFIQTNLRE